VEVGSYLQQVNKIRIRSIIDPLFIYGLFVMVLGVIVGCSPLNVFVAYSILGFGGLMMLTGLVVFIIFAFSKPEYLRSEAYQLKRQSLEMIGDKDNIGNPHIGQVIHITSPRRLKDGDDELKQLE